MRGSITNVVDIITHARAVGIVLFHCVGVSDGSYKRTCNSGEELCLL